MKTTIKYLIKFGDETNILKLFENGEIFMNTVKTFKESERMAIGDKYEGTVSIKNFTNGKLTLYGPNSPVNLKTTKLQLSESHKFHIGNIFCTYALSDKLLSRKKIHKINTRMQSFGSHCLIIKDVTKFLNAIFTQLNSRNIAYSHNLVKYHNYTKNNHKLTIFDKPHNLAYQKEHRIIAYTDLEEPLILKIGSLKEYAELYQTKFLIKNSIFASENYIT